MRSSIEAVAFQKEWFNNIRTRISKGDFFVLENGVNDCREICLALDIPVVSAVWWSAIISAKRLSSYYFDLMDAKGYRNLCRYCVLPLACSMDHHSERAPWGGLPKPMAFIAQLRCNAMPKIFELWSREYGTYFIPFEQTTQTKYFPRWWETIKSHWDSEIEPHRIELGVEEFKTLIRF